MTTDNVDKVVEAIKGLSNAITPSDACGNEDASGVLVDSLTEAVMGMTAGLIRIADSISELASAVRDLSKE